MEEIKLGFEKLKQFCIVHWKKFALFLVSVFAAIFSYWQINIKRKEIVAIDTQDHALTREMLEKLDMTQEKRELSKEIVTLKELDRHQELIEDTEKIDAILREKVGLKKWDGE